MNADTPRPKRAVIQIRLLPSIKQAAIQAAEVNGQSLSGYIEIVLRDELKRKGFLK